MKFKISNYIGGEGFTIIELVIAIFILFVATFAVYNAFSTIVVLTAGISDRLTATYLAQEGIEVIRNIRDANWINDRSWDSGLNGCSDGCQADYTTGTTIAAPWTLAPWAGEEPSGGADGGGILLKLNANGFYAYGGAGSDTKFKRKITITSLEDYIMRVSVKVFWSQKGDWSQNVIEAEEILYDWH